MNGDAGRPALRIVRGEPTPEEVAVLTALVTAAAAGDAGEAKPQVRRGGWNEPSRMHRRPLHRGPNGWWAALR